VNLAVESYLQQRERWPGSGRQLLAQYDADTVVVYQAYRPEIGHVAARHGRFGDGFSLSRMSWIKPNFLWMMYRSGWGTKEGQEVVLAIRLRRPGFDAILAQAVPSTFDPKRFDSETSWSKAVASSSVRLQWDPDHHPSGAREERRAIQLGLRDSALKSYVSEWIVSIEDISPFVAEQRRHLKDLSSLRTPREESYPIAAPEVAKALGLF
jgi:hypothetical protein